jgi:hypothetical protein
MYGEVVNSCDSIFFLWKCLLTKIMYILSIICNMEKLLII